MKTTEIKSEVKSKVNGAAKASQSTIDNALNSVPDVIDTVTEFGKSFLNNVSGSRDKAMQMASSSIQSVDKTLRSQPWAFVGGAAILGFVAGYLVARRSSTASSLTSNLRSGVDKIRDQIEKNINKVSDNLQ